MFGKKVFAAMLVTILGAFGQARRMPPGVKGGRLRTNQRE